MGALKFLLNVKFHNNLSAGTFFFFFGQQMCLLFTIVNARHFIKVNKRHVTGTIINISIKNWILISMLFKRTKF